MIPEGMANPRVDEFVGAAKRWRPEYERLREIVFDCGLVEEFKWMHPCYTRDGRNIVLIHGFKEYCALLFFKGALLRDPKGVLLQQTENVQSGRQMRFQCLEEIEALATTVRDYVQEAVEVEVSGLKVERQGEMEMPQELRSRLDSSPDLKAAFEALTPGRQRAYLIHFSQPKKSGTRASRVERHVDRILNGKGLND